jgi:hypothetical protein
MNGDEFGNTDWLRTFLLAPVTMFVNEMDNAPDNQANQVGDANRRFWDGAAGRPRIAVFRRRPRRQEQPPEQGNNDRGPQGTQVQPRQTIVREVGLPGPQGPQGPQGPPGQTIVREIRERGGENMVEVPVEQMMETLRDAGAAEVLRDQQQWNRTMELKKNIEGEIRQVVKAALEQYKKDGNEKEALKTAVKLVTSFTGEQIYELLNAMGYDNTVLEDRQGRKVAQTILNKRKEMLDYDPERLEKMFDYIASFAGLNGETVEQYKAELEKELQEYQAQLEELQEYQAQLEEAKNKAQQYQAQLTEREQQYQAQLAELQGYKAQAEEAKERLEYVRAIIQRVPDKGFKRGKEAYEALSDIKSLLEGGK